MQRVDAPSSDAVELQSTHPLRQVPRRMASTAQYSPLITECVVAGCLVVATALYLRRHRRLANSKEDHVVDSNQIGPPTITQDDMQLAVERKTAFVKKVGDNYGYNGSPGGHIDEWRPREFPNLISPLGLGEKYQDRDQCDPSISKDSCNLVGREVYLDYAGSALPTASQLRSVCSLLQNNGVLANPHSTGPAASRTSLLVERAKKLIMDNFNAHPGKSYGIGEGMAPDDLAGNLHPGYDVVFTSGATESLKIVAESFKWSSGSTLIYPDNSHTSVVGMRHPAMVKGGKFLCLPIDRINKATSDDFSEWALSGSDDNKQPTNNLLVLPVECNFGGDRLDQPHRIVLAARQRGSKVKQPRWYVMFDLAKAAATGPVDLRRLDPDFACLSFYKIFGYPTGLGILFVKRTSASVLIGDKNEGAKRYFGGGSVDAVLSRKDFIYHRSEPSSLSSLVQGSTHFQGIASLSCGFDELVRVGGMDKVSSHSKSLAHEFCRRCRQLIHANGRPAIIFYGAWSSYDCSSTTNTPGPTVAFNVMRQDGSIVGYNEVSNLAGLHRPPIQLRTGCFCNPGACQSALNLSDKEVMDNYLTSGHICGDRKDIINNKPTGAIRTSFGKDSIWEDVDSMVLFLQNKFVSEVTLPSEGSVANDDNVSMTAKYKVAELFVFPIKSCAAMRVSRWKISTRTGKLLYDREFALVDSSGSAMRLSSFPLMAQISPLLSLENNCLALSAPGCQDLIISLDSIVTKGGVGHIRVCGDKTCAEVWGGDEASDWFGSFLGVQCWLVRHRGERPETDLGKGFANDAPLLVISQQSVNLLNSVLISQGSKQISSRHFRPNLVVSRSPAESERKLINPEDRWSTVEVAGKQIYLSFRGKCARCQMVDIDPSSGMKGETLRALADYRRHKGQIVFGIYLASNAGLSKDLLIEHKWIEEGDTLLCR